MLIGLLIFLSYTILAVNTAAIARGRYLAAAGTASLFMAVNFFLVQHIAEARSLVEFVSYLVGGVARDMAGIWVSNRLNLTK